MPLHKLLYLPFALLSFLVGLAAVQLTSVDALEDHSEPLTVIESSPPLVEQTRSTFFELPMDNCGESSDHASLRPIIRKWLRNEEIKNVPYCSEKAIEATSDNESNVIPELIDLNEDGIDELVVQSGCSPTGNCAMNVYQRLGKSYRQIFDDRQSVSYFDKVGAKHGGFRDLQTRSHGSCCDGGQVIYRFSGSSFKAISCSDYSYWNQETRGEIDDKAVIIPRSCKKALNSF